jgi:tRNA pseudouridine38-40 synthase
VFYSKAILQYDGSNYAGFQWQKNAHTIQEAINQALALSHKGQCTTMSASRTDSGVHALEQVIRITSTTPFTGQDNLARLNHHLPSQIRVLTLDTCEQSFNPALDSLSKEYSYLFTNRQQASETERKYVANISNPLNLSSMNDCIREIIGTQDFCNFVSTGSSVKTTIRTVHKCELTQINPHDFLQASALFPLPKELQSCFRLRIEANGFLKQMIRHLVAGLWRVGSGKLSVDEFIHLLHSPKNPKQLWRVATPSGLYLCKINY